MFFNKHLFGLDKISLTEKDMSDLFGLAGWLKSDDRSKSDIRNKNRDNPGKVNGKTKNERRRS